MNHTIYVQAKDCPAGLERLLRVVRYRGFSIKSLNMLPSQKAGHLDITATVDGSRPIDLLLNPLMKLYEVAAVERVGHPAVQVSGYSTHTA